MHLNMFRFKFDQNRTKNEEFDFIFWGGEKGPPGDKGPPRGKEPPGNKGPPGGKGAPIHKL